MPSATLGVEDRVGSESTSTCEKADVRPDREDVDEQDEEGGTRS